MRFLKTKLAWVILGILLALVALPTLRAHLQGCRHFPRRLLFSIVSKQYSPGPEIEFRRLLAGHGQGPKGSDFEIFEFRSSDCVEVDSFYYKFASKEDAAEEMQRRIKAAARVLSPLSKSPSGGTQVLERAVISNGTEYLILRKTENRLHSIASPSLSHALEFEKRGGRVAHSIRTTRNRKSSLGEWPTLCGFGSRKGWAFFVYFV